MQKNKIKKYLSISLILAFILPAFTARADLVDDLIKEQKLDPKNNPKDQCDLMNELDNWVVAYATSKFGSDTLCEKNICSRSVSIYMYDSKAKIWKKDGINYVLIYKKEPYELIGLFGKEIKGYDDEYYDYNSYKKSRKNFLSNVYLFDIRSNENFDKAILQKKQLLIKNFDDGELRLVVANSSPNKKEISYFKVRGCYIEDFKINKKDKNLYQPKIIN